MCCTYAKSIFQTQRNHIAIEHPPHIVLCDKINKICSSLYILQIQSSQIKYPNKTAKCLLKV